MIRDSEIRCLEYVIKTYVGENCGIIVFNNTNNYDLILDYLKTVIPNPQATVFPDFISNDVIIEHFSVTSSKENRKGSSFKREKSINDKETKKTINEWQKNCNNASFNDSNVIENLYDNLSYDNFLNSLSKNLSHHIESLNKYDSKDKKVIFMIELQDAIMGIYRYDKFFKFYELNKDKKALDIIKPFIDLIDVLIFRANDRIEIIDVNKFNILYKNARCEDDIRGGRLREVFLNVKLDLMV